MVLKEKMKKTVMKNRQVARLIIRRELCYVWLIIMCSENDLRLLYQCML